MMLPAWIVDWLRRDSLWKFAVGGRGSAKTHSLVRAALAKGYESPENVLCLREVQDTLDDSVLKVIRNVVASEPELDAFYDVKRSRVTGLNGTQFRFRGLSEVHGTARGIRGAEAVTIFLIDEAQYISEESLRHLTPTIRSAGAEAWVALNPRYEDDPLYALSLQPDEDILVYTVNWQNNPFWSAPQEAERKRFKRMFPDLYDHEYEGALVPDAGIRMFPRTGFKVVDKAPEEGRTARGWDFATSDKRTADRTAGVKVRVTGRGEDSKVWLLDVTCGRWPPGEVLDVVKRTAAVDGREVTQVFERERGGAGDNWVDALKRAVAAFGVGAVGVRPTGDKPVRARGIAAQCALGNVHMVRGAWNRKFLDEAVRFPEDGRHDDQVDALAYAYNHLAESELGSWLDMI